MELNLKKYLLDTNAIIYALNEGFRFPKGEYLISIISEIELLSYSGLTSAEEQVLKNAIKNFITIDLNNKVKNKTIDIRKKTKLKLPDSIIVSSAIEYNAVLITSDKQLLNLDLLTVIELSDLK